MLLVILWILHLFIFFYEWKRKSLGMVLWAMLFVVFTIPHTVHIMLGDYTKYVLDQATIFVILFLITYIIIRVIVLYHSDNNIKVSLDKTEIRKGSDQILNLFFSIYVISFIVVAIGFYGRGYTLSSSTWTEMLNRNVSFVEEIAYNIIISFSGLGFVCFIKKKRLYFLILCGIFIFYLVLTKSRYNLLGFVTPFMIYFLFNKDKKKVYLGVSAGVAFVFLVFLFQQMRWLGAITNVFEVGIMELVNRSIEYMKEGGGELGLIKAFYYFIENNNNFQDFGEGNGLIRLALMVFPSAILSFKPRDFAIDMYREWFHVNNPNGTMHPTLFGDAYANIGFGGWILGGIAALLVSLTDEVVSKEKDPIVSTMKISLICTMFVLLGRGAVYNSIFNFVLGWILIEIVVCSYKITKRRKNKLGNLEI